MDIFGFAMEKEKYAEHFYRELADRTDNTGLKNILNMLAGEEVKHYETVKAMQHEAGGKPAATDVLKHAEKTFAKMRDATQHFDFDISEVDLYRKACQIEKQSRDFYLQKADAAKDPNHKTLLRQLAEEENKHLVLVQRLCDFLAKPETFLENAEMYHFDDYVEGEF